ncbi:unnamed protein product [Closterium sp. Naga37s-1]|nr:unnamed protein product [Closterium sp. Naga37s-1]
MPSSRAAIALSSQDVIASIPFPTIPSGHRRVEATPPQPSSAPLSPPPPRWTPYPVRPPPPSPRADGWWGTRSGLPLPPPPRLLPRPSPPLSPTPSFHRTFPPTRRTSRRTRRSPRRTRRTAAAGPTGASWMGAAGLRGRNEGARRKAGRARATSARGMTGMQRCRGERKRILGGGSGKGIARVTCLVALLSSCVSQAARDGDCSLLLHPINAIPRSVLLTPLSPIPSAAPFSSPVSPPSPSLRLVSCFLPNPNLPTPSFPHSAPLSPRLLPPFPPAASPSPPLPPLPPRCLPFPALPPLPSPCPPPPPSLPVPAPAPPSPASSHLSDTADDSACLTASHGFHAPSSAVPHAAVAHPATSPPAHATRWDVPLFSAKRACLAAVPHRPAEGAAWAERPGAWGEGPAAFQAQGREAAAAAAAAAGKAEGRGVAWRALSASSVDFAPQPFQPITESDLLLKASGSGAPLAFAVGAAAGAHGDGRGGLHHPSSSARSIGASMESGARTRRVVCARGRKRRGAGGDPGQQVAMARRAGDAGALIEAGGWAAAQGEGEQSSCAYGGERDDAEDGARGEEEAERREGGGGVGAESAAQPRRRRRKVGLVGVAEEGEVAEERDGVAAAAELSSLRGASSAAGAAAALGSTARRPPHAHAPVLAGCGAVAGGRAGSASVEGARRADGAVSANACAPSSPECRAPEGSSGDSSACERESTGSEQRAGRRRSARVLQETVNGARNEGLRDEERGDTRQRQRHRPNGTVAGAGGTGGTWGGAGEEAEELEAEMRRRFSVVVQSQVGGGEEEDGPLEGEADRCMSDHVGAAKFVLSSGRTLSAVNLCSCLPLLGPPLTLALPCLHPLSFPLLLCVLCVPLCSSVLPCVPLCRTLLLHASEGLPAPKKKPTIDDEFEQYFAQLLL